LKCAWIDESRFDAAEFEKNDVGGGYEWLAASAADKSICSFRNGDVFDGSWGSYGCKREIWESMSWIE